MKLRSGKIIRSGNKCLLWQGTDCHIADRRPHEKTYIAHNKANFGDYSFVSRSYYYCPNCKKNK